MSRVRCLAAATGLAALALAGCAASALPAPDGITKTRQSTASAPAPAKLASQQRAIPAGATLVTVTLHPDMNIRLKPPQPATVTDPAEIRELAALVDGLPLFPPGTYSCPADAGAALGLTFRAVQVGPALAVVTVDLEGCEGVNLSDGGRQTGLGPLDGGRGTAARALKIAGLNWNLGRFTAFLPRAFLPCYR